MALRKRLDQLLVDRHLVDTRSLARRLILAGRVQVDGRPAGKPGTAVAATARLHVVRPPRFVSRGGDKLEPVLAASGIEVSGLVCIDIGASTGGFTDCLLQQGARQVVAVDVGYGQLDWRLRQDERVQVIERCNARYLEADSLAEDTGPIEIAVMDVSFISAAKLLPTIDRLCAPRCRALVLVKPQFEAGPTQVEKGGVVLRAEIRRQVLGKVATRARDLGWNVVAAHASPLRGPAGNWECFLQLSRGLAAEPSSADPIDALIVPDDAHGADS